MSNKRLVKVFSLFLVIALLLAVLPVNRAKAAALYCVNPGGTGGCYASIDTVVDLPAVVDGDIIYIQAGTYTETVTTTKRLNFIGEVDEEGNALPVLVGSLTATLTDAVFSWNIENINFKAAAPWGSLLKLTNANGLTVKNSSFDGAGQFELNSTVGIELVSGSTNNLTVDKSIFKNGLKIAISGDADSLTVKNTKIENVISGIEVTGAAGNSVAVENTDISVIAKATTISTFGVNFIVGKNLSISGSSILVDKNSLTHDVGVEYSAIIIGTGATGGSLKAEGNSIFGDVTNASLVQLDASPNWWGDPDGPVGPLGAGYTISANVLYDPWLELYINLDNSDIDENQPIGEWPG